jgi:hypothetical protein
LDRESRLPAWWWDQASRLPAWWWDWESRSSATEGCGSRARPAPRSGPQHARIGECWPRPAVALVNFGQSGHALGFSRFPSNVDQQSHGQRAGVRTRGVINCPRPARLDNATCLMQNQEAKCDVARTLSDRSRRGLPRDRSRRPGVTRTKPPETALNQSHGGISMGRAPDHAGVTLALV